ncbi:hypothetical protein HYZ97_03675 [Candidatus Pacearchaeota archaeon]|nr:hypothetical protein [Candidatus Pacearchaeota archaeon]
MVEFDLQKFLSEIQAENRINNSILNKTVENGFAEMRGRNDIITANLNIHEKLDISIQAGIESRLMAIESVMKSAKWFLRAGIAAFMAFAFDLLLHHLGVKI